MLAKLIAKRHSAKLLAFKAAQALKVPPPLAVIQTQELEAMLKNKENVTVIDCTSESKEVFS